MGFAHRASVYEFPCFHSTREWYHTDKVVSVLDLLRFTEVRDESRSRADTLGDRACQLAYRDLGGAAENGMPSRLRRLPNRHLDSYMAIESLFPDVRRTLTRSDAS